MSRLQFSLFGRFQVCYGDQVVAGLDIQKVQELVAYIFLNRGRPLPRETLAGVLWPDSSTAQSRRYLRQALWQLNSALVSHSGYLPRQVLSVDNNFISLNPQADLWLDVARFEQIFTSVKGLSVQDLDEPKFQALQEGVQLYRGDLLEGWYQDWCLFERERLQNIYISMLDKLMGYCEIHQQYETGALYGTSILKYDRAHESTHRALMRLYYLSGNRTKALRQYERCVEHLEEELGVRPSVSTNLLHEQILNDKIDQLAAAAPEGDQPAGADPTLLPSALSYLRRFQSLLEDMQRQLRHEIQSIEQQMNNH